jgi:uncharacterized protein (DUF2252 family)
MTKLTERVDGRVRFISDPPLLVPVRELLSSEAADELETTLEALLLGYRGSLDADRRHLLDGYHVVDLARKVVGVGSVGTRAWVVLLHGRDAGDPLVMQAKEAQESVLARWVGPGAYVHEGERVVQGQRLIQAASDVLLGWDTVSGFDGRERDFYVRQLWDGKYSPDVETMPAQRLDVYVSACAWTLARGHARSGDRIAIAAYVGKGDVLDVAIAEFARDYADQNERDHARLEAAVRAGHVPARTGI